MAKRISLFEQPYSFPHNPSTLNGEGEVQEQGGVEGMGRGGFAPDYEVDLAQRKPMVGACCSGEAPPRVAARSMWGLLFQDPPRTLL